MVIMKTEKTLKYSEKLLNKDWLMFQNYLILMLLWNIIRVHFVPLNGLLLDRIF